MAMMKGHDHKLELLVARDGNVFYYLLLWFSLLEGLL